MKQKDLYLIGAAVVCLGAAAFVFLRNSGESSAATADFPDGIHWLCLESDCGHEFNVSRSAYMEFRRTSDGAINMPCPECGSSNTTQAEPCVQCGRLYVKAVMRDYKPYCPHCDQEITRGND